MEKNTTELTLVTPSCVKIDAPWIETRDKLLSESTGLIVKDQTGYSAAELLLKRITAHSNELEDRRKGLTRPFNDAASSIKKMADDARASLEERKSQLKKNMADYIVEQNRIRQEAEEAARRQQAEQAEVDPFGAAEIPAEVIIPGKTQKFMSSAYDDWTFEVVNPDLVPRAFCSPDEKKIREYVKANKEMATISGVTITKEVKVKAR